MPAGVGGHGPATTGAWRVGTGDKFYGSGANYGLGRMNSLMFLCNSCCQDSCPDFRRGLPLSRQSTQIKLPFVNAMYELDATDCERSRSAAFQAQHRAQPGFHVAMVLLY